MRERKKTSGFLSLLFTVSFAQARRNAGKSLMLNLFSDCSAALSGLSSRGHSPLRSWPRRISSCCRALLIAGVGIGLTSLQLCPIASAGIFKDGATFGAKASVA